MGSLEDHKGFGALTPSFVGLEPPMHLQAIQLSTDYLNDSAQLHT